MSGGYEGSVISDIESGQYVKSFYVDNDSYSVNSVVVMPNGEHILSGVDDNTIRLWEIESGKEIYSFMGHTNSVNSVSVTPNGKYIVSGSRDNTIKLWEMESGKEIAQFVGFENGEWIISNTDGYYNCSDGAYIYFSFYDGNNEIPKEHPIYKERKKENLLADIFHGGQ